MSQELRDGYAGFTNEQVDVIPDPATGLTLRGRLLFDVREWFAGRGNLSWGPGYHDNLRAIYRQVDSIFVALAAGRDGGEVRANAVQAVIRRICMLCCRCFVACVLPF